MAPAPHRPTLAMADMAAARRRSALYGLDPTTSEIPHLGEHRPAGDALRRLSAPVLDRLLKPDHRWSSLVCFGSHTGQPLRKPGVQFSFGSKSTPCHTASLGCPFVKWQLCNLGNTGWYR